MATATPFVVLALSTLLLSGQTLGTASFHWTYEGPGNPSEWADHFPKCGGSSQSPIDIDTGDVTVDASFGPMTFAGFDETNDVTFTLVNTGHSVKVDVDTSVSGSHQISGGKLPGTYQLAQFHFHYGTSDDKGSEHAVDGNHFPMEMHMVAYDNTYADFNEAKDKPEGLAVVGVFFEVQGNDNDVFEEVVDNLEDIKYDGDEAEIAAFSLLDLLPNTDDYYRYSGSLTTPTCDESVVWTILQDTIKISNKQMETFRSTVFENERGADGDDSGSSDSDSGSDEEDGELIENNFRPTQPLNGRVVYSNN